MTWEEILNDPALRNLPFKIETNMSEATNKHGMMQSDFGFEIRRRLSGGVIINDCSRRGLGGG